ncbi:MAG TPA: hypothetical protein VLC46_26445 [Thermoanaerobaculia bacterium]|jgi:hypothetical protein|nr:hypothetical protein [Thermoanaerobaculia bacterium]
MPQSSVEECVLFLAISGERNKETLFESVPTLSKMAMAISFRKHPMSHTAMAFIWRTASIKNTSMAIFLIQRRVHEQEILLLDMAMAFSMMRRCPLE